MAVGALDRSCRARECGVGCGGLPYRGRRVYPEYEEIQAYCEGGDPERLFRLSPCCYRYNDGYRPAVEHLASYRHVADTFRNVGRGYPCGPLYLDACDRVEPDVLRKIRHAEGCR